MASLLNMQREICLKFGAPCLLSDDQLKMGISKTFDPAQFPLNGLRNPPQGDTRDGISGPEKSSPLMSDFSSRCMPST
jgi:hypothetical protein